MAVSMAPTLPIWKPTSLQRYRPTPTLNAAPQNYLTQTCLDLPTPTLSK